jgi:hypothetical protein
VFDGLTMCRTVGNRLKAAKQSIVVPICLIEAERRNAVYVDPLEIFKRLVT